MPNPSCNVLRAHSGHLLTHVQPQLQHVTYTFNARLALSADLYADLAYYLMQYLMPDQTQHATWAFNELFI